MIDRQHLRIVRAIDAEGTMTEAAKSLFLTQSALSHAMKKLEAHFDVPLWKKDGRRLTLQLMPRSVWLQYAGEAKSGVCTWLKA